MKGTKPIINDIIIIEFKVREEIVGSKSFGYPILCSAISAGERGVMLRETNCSSLNRKIKLIDHQFSC